MKRRKRVLENLGGKCERCGTKHRLHLHHIYYAKDSARWVEGKHDPYNAREKEADLNPERFQLLCVTCHGDYHMEQRIKQIRNRVRKRVSLITCKICKWVYFPNDIKKHEGTCDGKTPLERIRKNLKIPNSSMNLISCLTC